MHDKFRPVVRVYLSTDQKKGGTIKRLRYWVAVLAVADVLYTILVAAMLYGMVAR